MSDDADILETLAAVGPSFVIFAGARTGSTMLASMLNGHADLHCFGELFLRDSNAVSREMNGLHVALQTRFLDYETRENRWRAFLVAVGRRQKAPWGFKLMNSQTKRVRNYLLNRSQCRPIVLRRDNYLAVYASAQTAKLSGQGVLKKGMAPVKTLATFDRDEFLQLVAGYNTSYQRLREDLAEANRAAFEISYADLTGSRSLDVQSDLLDYLNAIPMELKPSTLRRNSPDILSRFTNPDAARDCINELGHADWVIE